MADEDRVARKRARRSKSSQTDTEDDLLSPCCQCKETLQTINAINVKLDEALKAAKEISVLKEEIKALQSKNTEVIDSLSFILKENEELKEEVRGFHDEMRDTREDMLRLEEDIKALKARSVTLESHSRRNNLRFFNIPEEHHESYEDAEQLVKSFIKEHLQDDALASRVKIERAYRVGKKHEGKVRPLIAKFWSFKDK